MKTLLKFILITIFVILVAIAANAAKTGHIIVFFNSYRLDFSLISGVILVIIIFIVLYYLMNIISGIKHMPGLISKWSRTYVTNRRRIYLNSAIIYFLANDYKRSYKMCKRVITYKNNTDEEFIALSIAIKISSAVKNSNREMLTTELDKYNARRYKASKKVILHEE